MNLNVTIQAPMMIHVLDEKFETPSKKKYQYIVLDDYKEKVREIIDIVKK